MKIVGAFLFMLIIAFGAVSTFYAETPIPFVYVSPQPNAAWVSTETTLAWRASTPIDETSLTIEQFVVEGSESGIHSGELILAKDGRTIIFQPAKPFAVAEEVTVKVKKGITTQAGDVLQGLTYSFAISAARVSLDNMDLFEDTVWDNEAVVEAKTGGSSPPTQPYLTVPGDFPVISSTVVVTQTGEGYLFLAPFTFWPNIFTSRSYMMIVEDSGELVYYEKMVPRILGFDFKKLPNGLLAYTTYNGSAYYIVDSSYNIVDTYYAGNGYNIDFHEFLMLPNGNALFMIYDAQPVDMSQYVAGGDPDAIVVGLVIQEMDTDHNVIFEWRSWDHIPFTESEIVDLTAANIDYIHGNALEVDSDGNILLSGRSLSEITKIDRETGEIIWRFGGPGNEFELIGDDQFFKLQHDIRRLPNGNISLYDNRLGDYSRAVEYTLDEVNKTATLVWEYRHDPAVFGRAMGSAQRLPNGNTLINWGGVEPNVTEVTPDGEVALHLDFGPAIDSNSPIVTYRAQRAPWQGFPNTTPKLVSYGDSVTTTLYYSWNGATEVVSYEIYGGETAESMALIDVQERNGFETVSTITPAADYCFFQVQAMDGDGQPMAWSNVTLADHCVQTQLFFPVVRAWHEMSSN